MRRQWLGIVSVRPGLPRSSSETRSGSSVLFFLGWLVITNKGDQNGLSARGSACAFMASVMLTIAVGLSTSGAFAREKSSIPEDPDQLLIVDCLLPGQVRKLGGKMTYLSPRRPVRTSASDCEIRGGEYVAYDRANYATALQVWLETARQGDAAAQTYVGEIFEKGLGREPDYAAAAKWYTQAADQGYAKAQLHLAYLYEQGLGVEQNELTALNLYRQASGITDDDLTYESEVQAARDEAQVVIDSLTAQLESQTREAEALRGDLAKTQRELSARRGQALAARREVLTLQAELDRQRSLPAADAASRERLAALEDQLNQHETVLQQQLAQIAALEATNAKQRGELAARYQSASEQDALVREQLAAQTADASATREQLAVQAAATRSAQEQLAAANRKLRATEQRVATLQAELAQERSALAADQQRLVSEAAGASAEQTQEIARQQAQLEVREQQLATQQEQISALQAQQLAATEEVTGLRAQLAASEKAQASQVADLESARALLASTQRRLSETEQRVADLTSTLEADRARLTLEKSQLENRQRGLSAAQQAQLQEMANRIAAQEARLAEQEVLISSLRTEADDYRAQVVELKATGERLAMRSTGTIAEPVPAPGLSAQSLRALPREITGASYHALVIGNNRYADLPSLETPENDARVIEELLKNRYGMNTRLMLNATRKDILSALNEYRLKLGENDNLLIYYAGHGELDQQQLRGYWLPVDARRGDQTEWISDQQITDQIGLMAARHVFVVADSCYSGTLTRSAGTLVSKSGQEMKRLTKLALLPSRTVLTSGGEAPVLDGGGGGHSIFARVFIEILSSNDTVLDGSTLYNEIFAPVRESAAQFKVEQSPRYSMLAEAGHLNGEFLFVPRS